jgi:hypothetical protein
MASTDSNAVSAMMDQNPYESPREPSGTKDSKPRSTVGGVIRLLCIVIGLMVAYALLDAFVVSMLTGGASASSHYFTPKKRQQPDESEVGSRDSVHRNLWLACAGSDKLTA